MKHRKRRRFRRRRQAALRFAQQLQQHRGSPILARLLDLLPVIRAFHDARVSHQRAYQRLDALDEATEAAARISSEFVARPLTRDEACQRMGLDPGVCASVIAEASSPALTFQQCKEIVQQFSIDRVARRTLPVRMIGMPYLPARASLICIDDLQANHIEGASYAAGRAALRRWTDKPIEPAANAKPPGQIDNEFSMGPSHDSYSS